MKWSERKRRERMTVIRLIFLLFPKSIPPHKKRRRRLEEGIEGTERGVQEGCWR